MLARTTRFIGGAAFLLAAGAAPAAAQATTHWNAAGDWSTAQNPNGVWTYGYSTTLGGSITPYTGHETQCEDPSSPGVDCWINVHTVQGGGDYSGLTAHNGTGAVGNIGTTYFTPGELVEEATGNYGYSIVRWTAPTTGTYNVMGLFGNSGDGDPFSQYVLEDSATIFTAPPGGSDHTTSFSFSNLAVNGGSTLDFVTYEGNGRNPFLYAGGIVREALEADITENGAAPPPVTTTPEPSSMALLGTGLIGLVPMIRRRRNSKI